MRRDDGSEDRSKAQALCRYQVISAYLAMDPPRGQRKALLEQLAQKTWTGPDGEPFKVEAETIRSWVRRYRQRGLEGLCDKPRPQRGSQVLTPELLNLAAALKREVPQRSVDRIIQILESTEQVPAGLLKRSTLHHWLKTMGLSRRTVTVPDSQDLDRFEAAFPNDLWQSDLLTGPWLPDPQRPGKVRRAYLYAYLDDHSRLLLHGRFSFKGDLPALELVLKRSMQKYGLPNRLYYDNGQVYHARHMHQLVAELGIHRVIYTKAYRPMGHGKIEALNRLIRNAFLAELKASAITTLDQLNEAFLAWMDIEYNRQVHSEIHQTPLARWSEGQDKVRFVDEERLRRAFLFRERRHTDKTGVFSLFGRSFQVQPALAGQTIEVRFDAEDLNRVEVYQNHRFIERLKPRGPIEPSRRPKRLAEPQGTARSKGSPSAPTVDWLAHLVSRRRQEQGARSNDPATSKSLDRATADQAIIELTAEQLDPAVFDPDTVRNYLDRFGPFDPERAGLILQRLVQQHGRDHHLSLYLEAIAKDQKGEP